MEAVPINTPDLLQPQTPESGAASVTSFAGVPVFKKGDLIIGLSLTLLLTCLSQALKFYARARFLSAVSEHAKLEQMMRMPWTSCV